MAWHGIISMIAVQHPRLCSLLEPSSSTPAAFRIHCCPSVRACSNAQSTERRLYIGIADGIMSIARVMVVPVLELTASERHTHTRAIGMPLQVISSTGTPIPAQWARRWRCRYRADVSAEPSALSESTARRCTHRRMRMQAWEHSAHAATCLLTVRRTHACEHKRMYADTGTRIMSHMLVSWALQQCSHRRTFVIDSICQDSS